MIGRVPANERARSREDAPPPIDITAEDARGLKEVQLELLAELDRVCRLHDLPYFALYGTLLGAVRHQGFIPWDDDLDIGMLRDDYERLAQVIDQDLGDAYFFQTLDSDPHYGYGFGKLRKNGTRCVDLDSYGSRQHNGVYIDVFPLDAKPTGRWAQFEQKTLRYGIFLMLYLKARYLAIEGASPLTRLGRALSRGGVRLIPRRLLVALTRYYTRLGRAASPAKYVSLFGAYFYDHDTIDARWILPLGELPFEDTTIPVPADPDGYLTQLYGDYLQLPPADQQVGRHEIVELTLGEAG